MKILIYNSTETIKKKIKTALIPFQNWQIISSKDHNAFKKDFASCLSGETIIVFFIYNENDLNFLESIQNDFVDIKLIISLSEEKYQTRALKLQPRIITDANQNIELLLGIIQGCIKEKQKNQLRPSTRK